MKIEVDIDDAEVPRISKALGLTAGQPTEVLIGAALAQMLQKVVFNYEQQEFQKAFVPPKINEET